MVHEPLVRSQRVPRVSRLRHQPLRGTDAQRARIHQDEPLSEDAPWGHSWSAVFVEVRRGQGVFEQREEDGDLADAEVSVFGVRVFRVSECAVFVYGYG